MSSLNSIIKFNKEESNTNEENKVDFEIIENSNLKTLNQQIMASSINGIEDSINNCINVDDSLKKNISIYNNLNEKEEKKANQKDINNIEKKVEEKKEKKFNDNNIVLNDIISDDLYNTIYQDFKEPEANNDKKIDINKEEITKDDDYYRDRTYSFKPKKPPSTPNLCQKDQKPINEFNLNNDNNNKVLDTKEFTENFTETLQTKIENNENNLPLLKDQITNKQDNININNINNINSNTNNNRTQSFDADKNEQNNDESEDNTYKEEEDFLEKEELRRKKKEETNNNINNTNIIINKEIKNVDVIEERKDEEEEDNEDEINKMIEEEAQKKYLEEQDKKKNLQKVRNEIELRTTALRESIEQNRRKLMEKLNQNKNEKNNFEDNKDKVKVENKDNKDKIDDKDNNEIKEKEKEKEKNVVKNYKKESKIEINNSKKYGDKINAKKKQLSSTVFNRLYQNEKKNKKELEKEKKKEKEKINDALKKNNNKNKNKNKINKSNTNYNDLSYRTNNKIDTFIINETENISEENNNKKIKSGHFPIISELKKEFNNTSSKIHKKQNTNTIKENLTESKNSEKSKKMKQLKQPIIIDDTEYETYSFKPEINQMSINLCKKKFKKRKNSSPLSKKIDISDKYIENRRLNTPIGELLYEDAFNKRQKLENMTLKEKKEIKKDGNKSLISKGSESLLFKKNELKLKEIIDRYSQRNKGELSIVGTIQCLWEMHILRELLQNSSKTANEIDLEYIKTIVDEIMNRKSKGTRHYDEIEFVEQLWIKINPFYKNEKDFIDKDSLFQFLKILFSFNEQIEMNKMISKLDNFLKIINKKEDNKNYDNISENKEKNDDNENKMDNNNENNIENNNDIKENAENNDDNIHNKENNNNKENNIIRENNENNINVESKENNNSNSNTNNTNKIKKEKKYISLLRNKEFTKNDIWHLSKFIRVFFELKKLISNYQTSKKDKIFADIMKEREKELTFQPDFNATSSYFHRKNLKDKKEDLLNTSINSNLTTNSKANKKKRDFNKLYEEFMLKKQMHEKALMILRENKEKRELRMCTDRPSINKNYKIKNRKKTPEVGCTRNEFLYNLNKDILNKRKENLALSESQYLDKEKYPFRPNISTNESLMNKSFREGPQNMPKGSKEYIKRNRSYIQFKKREKNNLENKTFGTNYDKIKNQKVNLPKIKDLEPNTNLTQQKDTDNNSTNNDNETYFTIQVKTAKGRIKPLKIYINNNPIETANKFCDENNIKEETREKIIQKIKELKIIYKGIEKDKKE